jgi:hypothetical protein
MTDPNQQEETVNQISCNWCRMMTPKNQVGGTYCIHCCHRADMPRVECDCPSCEARRINANKEMNEALDQYDREDNPNATH